MKNLLQLLEENTKKFPQKTALSFRNGDEIEILTWKKFWAMVCQTANGLHTLDVKKGDCVGVFSQNSKDWIIFDVAVNSLLSRLDDAARRQEGFAADVAHELKTPLAVAMLELGRLKTADADRVSADLASMNRLVEQLLVLAQLDAYAAAPQPFRPINLADAALEAIKLCAVDAAQKGVALAYRDEGGPMVMGRIEAVTAALRNLVENGVRVTAAGKEVTIVRGPGPNIRVVDGGPGIEPARLLALSDRFRRGEHASYGGAGLGLSIVARIMEVHGGAMTSHPEQPSIELDFDTIVAT